MFIRVWVYEVPSEHGEAFAVAYGPDGPWGELFRRGSGYLGTELYRAGTRFLTIDRWVDEHHWKAFLDRHRDDYEAMDNRLEGLATSERAVFEGS